MNYPSSLPCGPRGATRAGGFTLIELILALGLTALLLVMLSGGVYSVVRDWDNNAAGLESTLDETVTLLQIERALHGAFPHSYRDTDSLERLVYFDGEAERLAWISTVSPQRDSGLIAWHLYSVPNEGVYLQLAPAFTDHPGERLELAEPMLILPDYEATFRYLYEDLDFTRRWQDEWDGGASQALPLAVHVLLEPARAASNNDIQTDSLEIVAPVAANQHRSIRNQALFQGATR